MPSSIWLVYGAAILSMLALMWRYTDSWPLTLSVLAGGAAAATATPTGRTKARQRGTLETRPSGAIAALLDVACFEHAETEVMGSQETLGSRNAGSGATRRRTRN